MKYKGLKTFLSIAMILGVGTALGVVSRNEIKNSANVVRAVSETVTYKITSKSAVSTTGNAPTGSTAKFVNTYSTKDQITSGNSMTLTLSGYKGYKITGFKMNMHSNSSKGAGTLTIKAGDVSLIDKCTGNYKDVFNISGNYTTTYESIDIYTKYFTPDGKEYVIGDEDINIVLSASVNSLYCSDFELTYEEGEVDNRYLVSFESNGGSIVSSQKINNDNLSKATLPEDPTKELSTFVGWYVDEELTTPFDFDTPITSNTILYAKWNDIISTIEEAKATTNKVKIQGEVTGCTGTSEFYIQDSSGAVRINGISSSSVKKGQEVIIIGTYDSSKSYLVGESFDIVEEGTTFSTSPLTSLEDCKTENQYKYVEINNLKISSYESKKAVLEGTDVVLYYNNASYVEGKELLVAGNYVDVKGTLLMYNSVMEIIPTTITKSTTYKVTYESNGGTSVDSEEVLPGNKFKEPTAPTKEATTTERYEFAGWYKDSSLTEKYDFNALPTGDITLYAKWNITKIGINESFTGNETKSCLSFNYIKHTSLVEGVKETSFNNATNEIKSSGSPFKFNSVEYSTNGYKFNEVDDYVSFSVPTDVNVGDKIKFTYKACSTGSTDTVTTAQFKALDAEGNIISIIKTINDKRNSITNAVSNSIDYVLEENVTKFIIIVDNKETGSNFWMSEFSMSYNGMVEKVTYDTITNLAFQFKYDFEFSSLENIDTLQETGLLVTSVNDYEFIDETDTLPTTKTLKFVNEEHLDTFVVAIEGVPLTSENWNVEITAVSYIKVDGKYYFGTTKTVSLEILYNFYSQDSQPEKTKALAEALYDQAIMN